MLRAAPDYETLRRDFRWDIPARYNMGVDCCDRHADGQGRPALIMEDESGAVRRYSFDDIRELSNRFANVLAADGLQAGDRLAILLPQAVETGVAHVAAWKSGLISIPLFTLFGQDALEYRLADSGARALVTDRAGAAKVMGLRERLPALTQIYVTDGATDGAQDFHAALHRAPADFVPLDTAADDPAVIIYTSGTTGQPQGRAARPSGPARPSPRRGASHDFFPQRGDLFWTPADWAWIGGLFDVLMPACITACPVLAHRPASSTPARPSTSWPGIGVRNVFLPPTALKMMRLVPGRRTPGLACAASASGGETLGEELLEWGRATSAS